MFKYIVRPNTVMNQMKNEDFPFAIESFTALSDKADAVFLKLPLKCFNADATDIVDEEVISLVKEGVFCFRIFKGSEHGILALWEPWQL